MRLLRLLKKLGHPRPPPNDLGYLQPQDGGGGFIQSAVRLFGGRRVAAGARAGRVPPTGRRLLGERCPAA